MKRILGYLFRTLMMLVVIGGGAAGLVWSFWPQPLPVELTTVGRDHLRVTIDEDGKTRIRERYVVSTPLAGRLLRIDLDEGDAVQIGTTEIAVIEPKTPEILDAREVALAKAKVQAAEATLKRVEPIKERVRAEAVFAESELGRVRTLSKNRAVSTNQLEEAEMRHQTLQQDLRAASFAQDVARFELEMAKAALLQTQPSEANSMHEGRFEIFAPISGQVLRILQQSETIVPAGAPLLELGDPTDLEIEVDVLSADAVRISRGAKAYLEQWGGDHALEATVRLVEPSAFTKISALGVEEQRVNVILDLNEPMEKRRTLGDAYRVEARIVIWEQDDVLQVPTGALFRQRDRWAVFAQRDGKAVLQIVEIGQRNSRAAEITSGLQDGDRVILHPSDKVVDGIEIVPREVSGE